MPGLGLQLRNKRRFMLGPNLLYQTRITRRVEASVNPYSEIIRVCFAGCAVGASSPVNGAVP